MYTFKPMTDKELDQPALIEPGEYNFKVLESEKMVSKKGNDMARLKLEVYNNEGEMSVIFDYLVFSESKFNIRKIKKFCDSVGLLSEYEKGVIPEKLMNLTGKLKLILEKGNQKDDGSFYPDRIAVEDYIGNKDKKAFNDDDLPF